MSSSESSNARPNRNITVAAAAPASNSVAPISTALSTVPRGRSTKRNGGSGSHPGRFRKLVSRSAIPRKATRVVSTRYQSAFYVKTHIFCANERRASNRVWQRIEHTYPELEILLKACSCCESVYLRHFCLCLGSRPQYARGKRFAISVATVAQTRQEHYAGIHSLSTELLGLLDAET